MKKTDLAHIVRAAGDLADDDEILVIGSQSILASFSEDDLPEAAVMSVEADIAFFDDSDETKSDKVDGAIGEDSIFHMENGYYGQGVDLSTAHLPKGWEDRLVPFSNEGDDGGRSRCLEPHDLVVSKLVAGRSKDLDFARALIQAGKVDVNILRERVVLLDEFPPIKRRLTNWLSRY